MFIPQKTCIYPPPPESDDEHTEEDKEKENLHLDDVFQEDDVIRRDLSSDNHKLYPVPPRKRWIPRGYIVNPGKHVSKNVWVTDVTCNRMTVTILESETREGFFRSQSVESKPESEVSDSD